MSILNMANSIIAVGTSYVRHMGANILTLQKSCYCQGTPGEHGHSWNACAGLLVFVCYHAENLQVCRNVYHRVCCRWSSKFCLASVLLRALQGLTFAEGRQTNATPPVLALTPLGQCMVRHLSFTLRVRVQSTQVQVA